MNGKTLEQREFAAPPSKDSRMPDLGSSKIEVTRQIPWKAGDIVKPHRIIRFFGNKGGIMKITTRTVGDVRILDCSGKITLDKGMLSLRNTLQDTLQGGANKIVLNLAHTKYIDSSGIGELVHSYNSVTNGGGQMRLLNLTKRISDPLVITQLLEVFKTFNDEQSAIASFG
jgi:anti-sigma B factor antagonist